MPCSPARFSADCKRCWTRGEPGAAHLRNPAAARAGRPTAGAPPTGAVRAVLRVALVVALGLAVGLTWFRLVVIGGDPGPVFVALMSFLALFVLALVASLRTHGTRAWPTACALWMSAVFATGTYIAIDVIAGWFLIVPLSPPTLADAVVHHRLRPDVRFESTTDEYHYVLHVNSLGTRGREVEHPKPRGTYRILMLGDSFTLGKGVDDDETFSALVGERLNRRLSSDLGVRFEIVNGGVDSYSPILSYLQLESIAPTVQPDLVVLNLDMSDLEQDTAYRSLARRDAAGAIMAVPSGEYPGEIAWAWIDRHLYITRVVLHLLAGIARPGDGADVRDTVLAARRSLLAHTLVDDRVDRTAQWRNLFDSIRAIQAYCVRARIPFLLSTYPWGHQVGPQQWRKGRWLFLDDGDQPSNRSVDTIEAFSVAEGIDFVDAFAAFREHADEALYFDRDLHWRPAGHRLMAEVLGQALEARLSRPGWVQPTSTPEASVSGYQF